MKPATIKALKELCDALIHDGNMPCDAHTNEVIKSADRLKRVLDEEPSSHCDECAPEFGCWDNPEQCRKKL